MVGRGRVYKKSPRWLEQVQDEIVVIIDNDRALPINLIHRNQLSLYNSARYDVQESGAVGTLKGPNSNPRSGLMYIVIV